MKRKPKIIKGFDTVKFFRKVKNKISREISGMNEEQIRQYFDAAPKIFPRKSGDNG
jgi:hypothetical protein